MGSRGDAATGEGMQGSPQGNAETGASTGVGGYGEFNLGGRLHRGRRIATPGVQRAGRGTCGGDHHRESGRACDCHRNKQADQYRHPALRKAALEAARKARFNAVEGLTNQVGTITYYFNLK